jgi:hypothetical protein
MSSLMSGYIDRAGRFVIGAGLRTAGEMIDGLALVRPYGATRSGYLDRENRWIVPPEIDCTDRWSERVAIFNIGCQFQDGAPVGGAWGIVGDGRLLVAPRFAELRACQQGLLAFRDGDRWGFVDRLGNVVIAAQFEAVGDFTPDGLAMAQLGGRQGLVDRSGGWRMAPSVLEIAAPSQGFGAVRTNAGWHLLDRELRAISEPFDRVDAFIAGMARAVRDERWCYLGPDGRVIGGQWFDDAPQYWNGLAPVRRGDDDYLFTAEGRLHGPFAVVMLAGTMEGLAPLARVVPKDRGCGLMAPDGGFRVDPVYDSMRGFTDGVAPAKRDGKWTLLDPAGRELLPPRWDDLGTIGDGLVPVRDGTRWGVVDLRGEQVIAPAFDTIGGFSSGLAPARSIRWPAVEPPPAAWHATPREGLTHPGFRGAGADDELRVTICFSENVTDDRSIKMQQIVANWVELCDAHTHGGTAVPDAARWFADYDVTVRLRDVAFPVEAAQLLTHELAAIGLPIQDVFYGRYRRTADPRLSFTVGWEAVPDPRDPGGSEMWPTFDAYATAAFDPRAVPPASESKQHLLAGRWNQRAGEIDYDERCFTLWQPGVRVCYGVTQEGILDEEDERSQAIAEALDETLAARFDRSRVWFFPRHRDPGPPAPMQQDGAPGIHVIEADLGGRTRRGYLFAIDSFPLLQDVGPRVYRYRETELMEALAEVVKAHRLEPVIMWQRFGDPLPGPAYVGWAHPMQPTVYVLNLWEP